LDPVADKLMVCTTLILLAVEPPAPVPTHIMAVIVVTIIGREITMSALREWAALSSSGAHKVRNCMSYVFTAKTLTL
jgi:phosphatidylglycerophosphate synthase